MRLVTQKEFSLNVWNKMFKHTNENNAIGEDVSTYYDGVGNVIGQIIRPSQYFLPEGDEIAC